MRALLIFSLLLSSMAFSQAPTANFTANTTSACVGAGVNFTSTSTPGSGTITQLVWDFGDGNNATGPNVTHAYTLPGTYTVTLVATNSNGQADPEVKSNFITVNPKPNAAFNAVPNGCTLPVAVTFNNTSTGGATYQWNFGNSQTSTDQNPFPVNYPTAGTFNASLIVTNSFGCKDTANQALVISNYAAGINAPATACVGTPVTISDASTVGANTWSWTLPGASPAASSQQNPTVTYAIPGTYTISLNSQNTVSGCTGNTSVQINVLPLPTPSFTGTPTSGCAPQTVTFTNNSGAGTFTWNFGDGQTFSGTTPPPHLYNNNGTYTVTLTQTAANGCIGTTTLANYIQLTAPAASFTSDIVDGCSPIDVNFTSTATSTDPITNYSWNFGNGNTGTGATPPTQTYTTGVYDVILTITTQSGCVSTDTIEEYIQVGEIDALDFTLADSPECVKTNIDFNSTVTITAPHDPDEVTYEWDFGVGEGTSSLEDPQHQYTSDTGYFDVRLIVTFRGCKDTVLKNDIVYIHPPLSRFTPSQTLFCNPNPLNPTQPVPIVVTVDDQAKIKAAGQDAQLIWRWGDGTPDYLLEDPNFDDPNHADTAHTYTNYGTYTIKQVIYNFTTGCSDSTTATIHITRVDITAMAPVNDSVCEGLPMQFNSTATTLAASHNPISYSWNMGNGVTVAGQNPTYIYPNSGTYNVVLTATNAVGCSRTQNFTPFRALETPSASISADDNAGCAPFLVTFTNNSQVNGNGVPLHHFNWDFPAPLTDAVTNQSNPQATVQRTFTTEGDFTVSLIATDNFGCVSPPATTVISITKPIANFTLNPVACNNTPFTLTNASSGVAPLSSRWYLDGITPPPDATTTDWTTTINDPGNNNVSSYNHNITLIVADVNGCLDTVSLPLIISKPVALFDFNGNGAATDPDGNFVCPPVFMSFTGESLTDLSGGAQPNGVASSTWQFGNGNQSTLPNPNNTYVFPGTYSATYAIVDQYGCTDDTTYIDFLTIFGPTATPSWTTDPSTCGQDVTFDLGATTNVVDVVWSPGDGQTVNDSLNFVHTYTNSNTTYNATVSVFDANGCEVAYPLNPITIPDNGLNAFFVADPNSITLGQTIVFDDQSSFNTPIVSWTWNLATIPEFTNNTGVSVYNTYYKPGLLTITLVVQDALGCYDTYTTDIFVDGKFEMPNVITTDGDGVNDVFEFSVEIFKSFDIIIVNRWGQTMSEQKNQTGKKFWDGRDKNGEIVSDGVYYYILNATLFDDSQVKKDGFLHVFSGSK